MQRTTKWVAGVLAAAALTLLAPIGAGANLASGHHGGWRGNPCSVDQRHRSPKVFTLTSSGRLACVDSRQPGRSTGVGRITGLTGDTRLVGIDFRPATGALVGLGDQGGIYTIDPKTAAASNRQQLSVALAGTTFGVDFNPTVDRLRIVSDTGQNLRVNVDTGAAVVDLALTAPGVAGAAYTNNDMDPDTATTLYDIDAAADQLTIQAPPNNGNLNPVGKLKVDTSEVVGFDIVSTIRQGTTVKNVAFASLTVGGWSGLYEIDLTTGRATSLGAFSRSVVDIAIPIDR